MITTTLASVMSYLLSLPTMYLLMFMSHLSVWGNIFESTLLRVVVACICVSALTQTDSISTQISDSSELAAAYAQSAFYRDEVASTFPPHLAGDKAPFPAHPKLFKDGKMSPSTIDNSQFSCLILFNSSFH